jgi:hypothetical protein
MKKRIPSKTSNFASLIEENAFYVDKTQFITKLELISDKFLFFLRPRRFGKSLLLSMLEYYYGIQHEDRFENLFGEYFIGKSENTTSLKNSYYTLTFNFSAIETDKIDNIRTSFLKSLMNGINQFKLDYDLLTNVELDQIASENSATGVLHHFFAKLKQRGFKGQIYLLIDEYDHFTNELFSFNPDHFKEIVSRNGWVRKFYEVVKIYMGEGLIDRFFATGVTPVTLDSMTSGFNVAANISLEENFHQMSGFTEGEVRAMIENTIYEPDQFDVDNVVNQMRLWYNGSRFSPKSEIKLYNPQMVVSFLSKFSEKFEFPESMADINVTSDYKKISNILRFLSKEDSDEIISTVIEEEKISELLTVQFNFELPFTRVEAISLLYFNGLLTIENAELGIYNFVIPNYVIKQMYWEYFKFLFTAEKQIKYDNTQIMYSILEILQEDKIDKLLLSVQSIMKTLSNRDIENFSEKHLKIIFMTMMMGTNVYFVKSEHETQSGYVDLILKRTGLNPGKSDILIELKYLKQRDMKNFAEIKQKGIEQATRYRDSLNYEEGANFKAFVVIYFNKSQFECIEV